VADKIKKGASSSSAEVTKAVEGLGEEIDKFRHEKLEATEKPLRGN
jgi:hypothetical protein